MNGVQVALPRAATCLRVGLMCVVACVLLAAVAAAQEAPEVRETDMRLPAASFASARELLRLFDISDSDWRSFRDGQPIGPEDQEALTKLLFRVPQIDAQEIARWERSDVAWSAVRAAPARERGEFLVVRGRVQRIERLSLSPRLATLFDFVHYYRLGVSLGQGEGEAILYSRHLPRSWQGLTQSDEPIRAAALFVKLGEDRGGTPAAVLVAPHIAWFPDRERAQLGIGADQLLLSQLGMDSSLWDDVHARHRLPIGSEERECFYALLRAVGRADPLDLARRAQPAALATLLQHPESVQSAILRVTGRVRRITRVVVDEPDIRQRYGLEAYYQLDVMVPVGDQPIEVRGQPGEQSGPVYREAFPVTCCALDIPSSWEAQVGARQVNQPAVLDGVFFKLWAYRNELVSSADERQRQLSPMFMVVEPQSLDLSHRQVTGPGLWIGLGLSALAVLVGGGVWAMNRADRRRRLTRNSRAPLDFE